MSLSKYQLQQEHVIGLCLVKPLGKPTKSNIHKGYKRFIDIVLSSVGLTLFAPIMLVIAFLVKLTSSGPVLFKQERLTQNERVFYILKFRTMAENAEAKTGPVWSVGNDTRVTPLGHFLRNTHLDELPQLFNVLMGDMSIVGPRPERPVFVEQFKAQGVRRYSDRHLAKAGITGYAQLQCPHPTLKDIHSKTQGDLWYIENWSLALDFWIMWRTGLYFLSSTAEVALNVGRKFYRKQSLISRSVTPYLSNPALQPVVVESDRFIQD